MMEQIFKPSLYLQFLREYEELYLKKYEDNEIMPFSPNKKFSEVWCWSTKVKNFLRDEVRPGMEEIEEGGFEPNSVWCKNMISRIRELRAKRGPNFTFRMLSDAQSSSSINMIQPSLHEEYCCELTLLMGIQYCVEKVTEFCKANDHEDRFNEDLKKWEFEVLRCFLDPIQQPSCDEEPDMSSWHKKKIQEARLIIAMYEPAFSLQFHDVESSSINIPPLHEELCYEIRSLIRMKCVDLITFCGGIVDKADSLKKELQEEINKVNKFSTEIRPVQTFLAPPKLCYRNRKPLPLRLTRGKTITDRTPSLLHKFGPLKKELLEEINKVNKFLTDINLQVKEKIPDQNSDWYSEKITKARNLIAKRYSAFPLRPQDLGYTKDQCQIFLSFRGEDTRYGFTRYLYNALHEAGFNVFMDDRGLERGDSISQVLMEAIENSKLSIIIFSENFANSTWCLDEVVKILECKQKKNQLVWPVFYKVEPSDVRHQNKIYGEAMTKHEARYGDDVVKNWRSALHEVCGFNAFPYKNNSGYECDFIQSIVSAATNIRDGL